MTEGNQENNPNLFGQNQDLNSELFKYESSLRLGSTGPQSWWQSLCTPMILRAMPMVACYSRISLVGQVKGERSDEEVLQKRIPMAVTAEKETFSKAIHDGRGSCDADQAPS